MNYHNCLLTFYYSNLNQWGFTIVNNTVQYRAREESMLEKAEDTSFIEKGLLRSKKIRFCNKKFPMAVNIL